MGHEIPEIPLTVDQRVGGPLALQLHGRPSLRIDPFDDPRDTDDTVGRPAPKLRLDQDIRHDMGVFLAQPLAAQHLLA